MNLDRKAEPSVERARTWPWVALVAIVSASTWWWWRTRGTSDVEVWLSWMDQVMVHGPKRGYVEIHADYPPGAAFVLWIVGHLGAATAADPRAVLKLVLLGFLLVTTGTVLLASRRAGLSAFAHAALVLNSFGLMYLDIFTAPFVLGAIWAAKTGREPLMAGLLAGACLMKWQPIFTLPFAAVYLVKAGRAHDRITWRRTAARAGAAVVVLSLLAVLIYGFSPLYDALYRASRHNDLSNFGANPLWILTWWFERSAPAGKQSLSAEGLVSIMAASRPMLRALSLITLIAYAAVLRKYWRSAGPSVTSFLRFSLAGYLVYFLCSAGVHENHLFLASLLGIALAWQEPKRLWVALVLAVAANLNLIAFYGWQGGGAERLVRGVDVTVWLALVISIALTAIAWRLTRNETGLF